jgi:hypothetical protein
VAEFGLDDRPPSRSRPRSVPKRAAKDICVSNTDAVRRATRGPSLVPLARSRPSRRRP